MEEENKSLSKSFTRTVLCVLGTAHSIGCTVNKKSPKAIIDAIKAGSLKIEE